MQHQEVTPFLYSNSQNEVFTVRTYEDVDHEVWFVAMDVCDVLELINVSKTCERLDEDEKLVYPLVISGQTREVLMVNESGLYSLIFTSRKPEARKFRKWVTNEVLPSIRKTGQYSLSDKDDIKSNKPALEPVRVDTAKVLREARNHTRGIPQGIMKSADRILSHTGLDDFQTTLALDKLFREYTGFSLLDVVGVRTVRTVEKTEDTICDITDIYWHFECDLPRQHTAEIVSKLH